MSSSEGQYLIFLKYTREYLSQVTGYSKTHLSRIAAGSREPGEGFIGVCCHALQERQDDLFKLIKPHEAVPPPPQPQRRDQELLDTIDALADRLTAAEAAIKVLQRELQQYR